MSKKMMGGKKRRWGTDNTIAAVAGIIKSLFHGDRKR